MKRITVFCGSSFGNKEIYEQEAYNLGKYLSEQNIELVYGGAKVGLMGAVANGALENNGKVIGVLPVFLQSKELAHEGLTELICVDTMHERKMKMHELSDGIIALPGGYGTLEEFFEILTWAQLGLHKKPVAILNTDGFYNDLLSMINSMVQNGFLNVINKDMIIIDTEISTLIEKMKNYQSPKVEKWLPKEKLT